MTEAEIEQRVVAGFWQAVAARGFDATSLRAVAEASSVPLATLRRLVPDPCAMFRLHHQVIDAGVLAGTVPGQGGPARDRVFDVLMRRVDALQPHREGILRLLAEPSGAMAMTAILAGLPRSMRWMLEAAELATGGARDLGRASALGAIWLATARAWSRDPSIDLGATMAALDRALDRAEQLRRTLRI